MTEIQMTRKLRSELFKIMSAFSKLKAKNVLFSDGAVDNLNEADIIHALGKINDEEDIDLEKPLVDQFMSKI